jgi:hypothetical protein
MRRNIIAQKSTEIFLIYQINKKPFKAEGMQDWERCGRQALSIQRI